MLHDDIKKQLLFEISEIDQLIDSYKLLFKLTKEKEPDNIETAAIATVLHSFYNGTEKLFLIILKNEQILLNKNQWHSELLKDMTTTTENRKAVISQELYEQLYPYMGFRHFFRHSYSFQISWDKMKNLVENLLDVWNLIKKDIYKFIKSYEK